jgi:hypothetical protein
MSYKFSRTPGIIIRLSDGANIPVDPGNRDYQAVLDWILLGNTVAQADPEPSPHPDTVDAAAASADTAVQTLRGMTPAQAATYVENNVNNLADAKALLKTMAKVICVLARRI